MDMETRQNIEGESVFADDVAVDWRGKPCKPDKHGGMRAAALVLGFQAFEIMAVTAVGNNLITYVFNEMHFPLSKSANIVTNFVGTIFLVPLLGGFLSDSYLGSFWTMVIFGFVELSGFILLSVQAHLPQLRPPQCNMASELCEPAKGFKAIIFFVAVYLVALGSGGVKPNIIAHGANQFRKDDPKQSKKLSTYFNAGYFAFCVGGLIALTVIVWVQTRSGMDVGFGLSVAAISLGLMSFISGTLLYRNKPPVGSIFTPIAQVFVAAFSKRNQVCSSNSEMLHVSQSNTVNDGVATMNDARNLRHTEKFRFLDKACIKIQDLPETEESPWRLCTVAQVQRVKIILAVIPIFACTIIFNTILAQLQTFSVQQGSAMDCHLTKSFKVPPASLQSIPYIVLIFVVPFYESVFVPLARKFTGNDSGISPLQRIGVGLVLVTFSMVSAALVENKRRSLAVNSKEKVSVFWIAPQFLIFGISEMFTAVGLVEFFYTQSLSGMQTFLTAMTYCSYSFGFFASSLLVSLVNKITSHSSGGGWLSDNDLNNDRLDYFYWLLATLNILNIFNYLYWTRWYSYSPSPSPTPPHHSYGEELEQQSSSNHVGDENIIP